MIYSILIAILISLGCITSEADYQNLTPEEQENYEIIIDEMDHI